MIKDGYFVITVPKLTYSDNQDAIVADGCQNNTNYYTDGNYRGTCCCSCDKDIILD